MAAETKFELYEQTVTELKHLPNKYLEEAYDFIKYLRTKSIREKHWKTAFRETLNKMNEISIKQGLTEKDIENEIELTRKGK